MYLDHYGFRELPFELTPNPRFLFLTAQHREALSTLEYGLLTGKAITLLTGPAGTGKTTLLQAALESDRCKDLRCIYLRNPSLTRTEFIQALASRFDLGPEAAASKGRLVEDLEKALVEQRENKGRTALIVDEAQCLSDELLEEIRLLANIETAEEKLLPVVLAGQPELSARLSSHRMQQLKQRVALRCSIGPMLLSETAGYIKARIEAVGGDPYRLFSREAVILVHESAGGIPRTVSVICDNALLTGFALGHRSIDREIVLEIVRELDLARRQTAIPSGSSPELNDLMAEFVREGSND
jgi:general secretion pathway protein A